MTNPLLGCARMVKINLFYHQSSQLNWDYFGFKQIGLNSIQSNPNPSWGYQHLILYDTIWQCNPVIQSGCRPLVLGLIKLKLKFALWSKNPQKLPLINYCANSKLIYSFLIGTDNLICRPTKKSDLNSEGTYGCRVWLIMS